MGLFKKVLSFLIEEEEEEEVYAEEYLEPISPKPRVYKEPEVQKMEHTTSIPLEPTVVKTEKVENEEVVVNRKVKHIEVDDMKPGNISISRENKRDDVRKEYEFTPVLSPMFGSKDDEPVKEGKPVILKGKKKSNLLGTVISPMYGAKELDKFEEEAKAKLEEKKQKQEEPVSFEQEELENMPLTSLLEDEVENTDDLIQFSLFGEGESVKSSKNDND